MKYNLAMLNIVAAGLTLAVAGCSTVEDYSLTCRLWADPELRKFSEPAPDPKLALFEGTNGADVLVQYDAVSEKHSLVRRQAYYLRESEALVAAGKKPKLAPTSEAVGLKPIPVLPTAAVATNVLAELPYALVTREGRGFTLHRLAKPDGEFELPVYPEKSGTPTRVALTPFAVAGDTVMVGVGVGIIGGMVWLYAGCPGLVHP